VTVQRLVEEDPASGLAALLEKPLANELQNLVDDTESAVRFLLTCVAVDIADDESKPVN
jgi:hypothetical protein